MKKTAWAVLPLVAALLLTGCLSADERLVKAAAECNGPRVVSALKAGADVHYARKDGLTALHLIAGGVENRDAIRIAGLLLERGADINLRGGQYGDTPLHVAVDQGNVGMARWLLENGAQVDAVNRSSMTPLNYAALNCEVEAARLLLESGATQGIRERGMGSPYQAAYLKNCQAVMDMLPASPKREAGLLGQQ